MKYWLTGAVATCGFEIRRSFTFNRLMVAVALALFPPFMIGVVARIFVQGSQAAGDIGQYLEFAMVSLVGLVCLLMLLLWATPNVHSEMEGKTWNFVVVRPGGRVACFLGKYFVAVGISFATALVSLAGCLLVANRHVAIPEADYKLACLAGVYGLACLVYGAIFSALGTMFLKRAMVMGAGFLIVVEVFLSALPALVSKFAMSYHLREIGLAWLGWFVPAYPERNYRAEFGPAWPVWMHVTCILLMMVCALTVGIVVITNRQYVTLEES